ncbi:MAG TPA: DNA methyltransferase [Phycisphaerales bacterium]|nr:DNA methyltransferase [Phycisphaerales bacterium]
MTPQQFVEQWRGRNLSERAASHTHFRQLCELLGVAAPYDNRADDADYCFDAITATAGSKVYAAASKGSKGRKPRKGHTPTLFGGIEPTENGEADAGAPDELPLSRIVSAAGDTHGFADVWKRGCFCWEYKRQGKHANLGAALAQLKQYRDSLDNPPLLIVCDVDHFEIHTNWTGFPAEVHRFTLEDLANPPPEWTQGRGISPLNALQKAFHPAEVEWFKPRKSVNAITEDLAGRFADLAKQIRDRKRPDGKTYDPHQIAHFLMQVVFCLFAEDTDLLRHDLFTEIVRNNTADPARLGRQLQDLFRTMEAGGDYGPIPVEHFNGGLFKNVGGQQIPVLAATEIGTLSIIAGADWSAIEPSILGTLFERALDPDKRAQIGAHYTSRDDIMLIVEPVILEPLRREWASVQAEAAKLIAKREKARSESARDAAQVAITGVVRAFGKKLSTLRILDPACGSGNFLYVAIQCLLDLEKEVIAFGARPEVGVALKPKVNPTQLHGIEINTYAAELARVSIWIGYLKWKRENGLQDKRRPILDALDTIENRDAILDWVDENGKPIPFWREGAVCRGATRWPEADFIVGNPPFLGSKQFRDAGLPDEYVSAIFSSFDLERTSDLCCYWFELGRRSIEREQRCRVGLLATQGIRGQDNRDVMNRIKQTGDFFMAHSDRAWVLEGAAVRVSMVGFDSGLQLNRTLDGRWSEAINADLTGGADLTTALPLAENQCGIWSIGTQKGGSFDIDLVRAAELLSAPSMHGKSNADVVRPWWNASDLTSRCRGLWIVEFAPTMTKDDAALYERPFEYVERVVYPERRHNRRDSYRDKWWIHQEPRADRRTVIDAPRQLLTPRVAKHRVWVRSSQRLLADCALVAFSRVDDYFFGVLQSSPHSLWAIEQGTQLESRPRYTPSSCFETFPLPWSPGSEPEGAGAKRHKLWKAIGDAAADLEELREAWLNPPEWLAPIEHKVDLKYRADLAAVPEEVRPLVRRSAIMAEAAQDKRLKQRTLTNLYNERPAWLRLAHEKLDRAVFAAYAAVDAEGEWDLEWAKVYEPFGAGAITIKESGRGADRPEEIAHKRAAIAAREPIDQRILASLLRLNHMRSAMRGSGRGVQTGRSLVGAGVRRE